ncbi:MAG: DNA mismatch repair endonuclease MutL [Thermodesulfobacteriota bacterium]
MSNIKILPENLANQIAAGEVVERPASVVKEFVENSIDAGASRIAVEVEGAGSRLIRVIDDGVGMDQDDILLSLERHATSKLHSLEQLGAIATLGFRGEAIPSIASVCRLTITSRSTDAALGNRVEVRYGQLHKVHEMGCAPGTIMEVRDLFGNVPARRKFLKSARTELAHVDDMLLNCVLAYPSLGVSYTVDNRESFSYAAGSETLEWRVRQIMGQRLHKDLIAVAGSVDDMVLSALLLPPDEGGTAAARLRIFVNRRPVRDRMMAHAVAEGMHHFLMKGRLPRGVVFLDLDPGQVDVNVHPAKQEIRFRESNKVHRLVVASIGRAMADYQQQLRFSLFGRPEREETPAAALPVAEVKRSEQPGLCPPRHGTEGLHLAPVGQTEPVIGSMPTWEPPLVAEPPPISRFSVPSPARPSAGPSTVTESTPAMAVPPEPTRPEPLPGLRSAPRFTYVGQFRSSYLLCETEEGICVIDQHAAHERLLFEKLKKQYQERELPGQALLFPEMIECTPAQAEVLRRHGGEIRRLGLTIEEFGGLSWVIKAVPVILAHVGPLEVVSGMFDHFLGNEVGERAAARRMDDILARMACKAAVKANDRLTAAEGEELVRRMEEADIFSHCPHGRPVVKFFSESDIKKWFFR